MNILVPIKQVPDTGMNLQLSDDQNIDEKHLKWILSPYDEFALEEAIKLKNQTQGKLYVVTLGPLRAKETCLTALALGADEALHLCTDKIPQDPMIIAGLLKEHLKKFSTDISLILCGKLSTDSNNHAVAQMLAGLLDWAFVTNINELQYQDPNQFTLKRESGHGAEEILQATGPLVLSADKGLNQPRYPSLIGIMKARKKPIQTINVSVKKASFQLLNLSLPKASAPPKMLEGDACQQVKELVRILKDEEKIL